MGQYIQNAKRKKNQPRILYPANSTGGIKTFPDKQKLRESVTTRSALRELLKGILQGEMKGH